VAGKADYARLIDTAIEYAKAKGGDLDARVNHAVDRLVCRIIRPPFFFPDALIVFSNSFYSSSNSARRFLPSFLVVFLRK